MNGSRSTFKRKGYWLTALAAAVLLTASSETAWAQVVSAGDRDISVSVPSRINEGETATITVRVTGVVEFAQGVDTASVENRTVTLTLSAEGTPTEGIRGYDATNPASVTMAEGTDFELYPSRGGEKNADGVVTEELVFPDREGEFARTVSIEIDAKFDAREAEDEHVTLTITAMGFDTVQPTIDDETTIIIDAETQTYTLALPRRGPDLTEGMGTFNVELEAAFDHMNLRPAFAGRLASQNGSRLPRTYSLDDFIFTEDMLGLAQSAVTIPGSDMNRVADTITIEALHGPVGDEKAYASFDVTIADDHMLPPPANITAVAKTEAGKTATQLVEDGDPVYLTVTVDRGTTRSGITDETLTVNIEPANPLQATDYILSVSEPIVLEEKETGEQSNDVGVEIELSALLDDDVGAEDLVLNLEVLGESSNGSGTSVGKFTIAVVDDTTPKVSPKAEADAYPMIRAALGKDPETTVMNPGETGTIMMGDLFTMDDGYTASYKVSESGGAVSVTAPDDTVSITANTAGTSKVTITATAEMAGSSFLPEQTVSDVAHITFEVTVVDTPLSVEVTAEPMEIDEGGTSMITATANRYVKAGDGAVTIDLVVVGDATLAADSITIPMGAMSGSVMLTATADDDMDNETLTVLATGSGLAAATQVTIDVTDTTEPVEPVPALPLIAQWLLGLGLMGGGARRLFWRRRQG